MNAFSAKWMQSFHILLHSTQNCVEKKVIIDHKENSLIERKKEEEEKK